MDCVPFVQELPEVIGWKVLEIIHEQTEEEEDELEVTVHLNREMILIYGATMMVPRSTRAWYYTGGTSWVLYSDGDIFTEPITMTRGKDPAQDMSPGEVWVLTLDDAFEQLHVSQCFPSSRGRKE